ncbi:MAG: hypothetical protein LC126_05085 [Bryobacterales bacterium]|nr:hypothetical protein [Bryobacterales bacterium]
MSHPARYNEKVKRRQFPFLPLLASLPAWAGSSAKADGLVELHGKLTQVKGQAPVLTLKDGSTVRLAGDEPTAGVLNDQRLNGFPLEVLGHYSAGGAFLVEPMHKSGLFVEKGGRKLYVTYWCDVCAIRTYTPGRCVCCQQETELDLRDKLDN